MAAIAFPSPELRVASPTTWTTTKAILLQSLGIIYFAAFLAAHYQNEGLMGEHGLMPAHEYFETVQQRYLQSSWWEKFHDYPSIFWFIPLNDDTMHKANLSGLTLSVLLMLRQGESKLILFLLWLLYFSVVTSAGHTSFYSYGWESQLLETGFLAIMLCDIWILPSTFLPASRKPQSPTHPSPIILWLFRWLCFRISIGAGLIKIRGDSCWTQKTCLLYHFETQPIPSPTSFLFHFLPPIILQRAVDLDLFVQVYTSWMVLLPTHIPAWPKVSTWCLQVVRVGGIIQAAFMVNIIVSGNLGFLPHLTIVPALACLDDACWPDWIQVRKTTKQLHVDNQPDGAKRIRQWPRPRPRSLLNGTFALLILYLSRPVVSNLLQLDGSRQQMNASFDPFRLVNTYGAFGSVGKQRYEPIVSISYDMVDDMNTAVSKDSLQWMELEFPCKPGSIHRRPCFCEPYHYRLDWNIWFIGFKPHQAYLNRRETWLYTFLAKLLANDAAKRPWLNLLDESSAKLLRDQYDEGKAPTYAKVDMYHYKMSAPLWKLLPSTLLGSTEKQLPWWTRTYEEGLIPIVELGKDQSLVRAPVS